MKKYRLLKEVPQGRVGSIWNTSNTDPLRAYMSCENGEGFSMLRTELFEWFEEIIDMPKFTKEQKEAIHRQLYGCPPGTPDTWQVVKEFEKWLDENTI